MPELHIINLHKTQKRLLQEHVDRLVNYASKSGTRLYRVTLFKADWDSINSTLLQKSFQIQSLQTHQYRGIRLERGA